MILAEDVRRGPGNDSVVLREMVERGDVPSRILLADSGYDCKGNEEIAIKSIKRGGCYKSEERTNLYLRWLFCRISDTVRDGKLKQYSP